MKKPNKTYRRARKALPYYCLATFIFAVATLVMLMIRNP
jgi:hypothetical protein